MKSLIVDKRAEIPGAGLHALIVGVSKYDYLPSYDDPPDEGTWNLCSLGAPASTASALADWFTSATDLAKPLNTLRLLMSPTAVEPVSHSVDSPTWDNFNQAVRDWRRDCADNMENIAFFYYGGHGFTRGRGEHNALLTMSDLFDPSQATLQRTVVTQNLLDGCAPQTRADLIAREQVFIFDCCRSFPDYLKDFSDRSVPQILDVRLRENVEDNRVTARFYATTDNSAAFASVGGQTYFGGSILDALQNAGRNERPTGWMVDGTALMQRLNARHKALRLPKTKTFLISNGPSIRILPGPPIVEIEVHLTPTENAAGRRVGLTDLPKPRIVGEETTRGNHTFQIEPGTYDLEVEYPANNWVSMNDRGQISPDFINPWITTGWP
ncbi:MAG: caspase family protein [Candidatus Thiodiazotropha sp.]